MRFQRAVSGGNRSRVPRTAFRVWLIMITCVNIIGYKVRAMILHAVSMVAVFVNQQAFEPIVLQCVSAEPDSWLKWLLPTIVQTVVSLASITAGVAIADWSFRKNRQSEHEQWVRNQQAGHEQWIRDQSKAEWKELMSSIADIEHHIPIIITGMPDHKNLESIVLGILP